MERAHLPFDCLQFWGWPEGKGAVCRKIFDLDDAEWLKDGNTLRLICGGSFGYHWLTPGTIRLNGKELATNTTTQYLDFDVTAILNEKGNLLEVEFSDGEKFTGMNGNICLFRRAKPLVSVDLFSTGLTGLTGFERNLVNHVNPQFR